MAMETTLGRVLIVDDERDLLAGLVDMLRAWGYDAVGFSSATEALSTLEEQDFDLLLADLTLPGMDGIELLRSALAIDPMIVGVIMASQGTVETAVEAMKVGAFDYLTKPFTPATVQPVLAKCMDVRRLRIENVQLREAIVIHELSKAVALTRDLDSILNTLADAVVQQCDADEVSVMLPTPDRRDLSVAAVRGAHREHVLGQRVPFDEGIAGWVAQHLEPVTLSGEVADPRFAPVHPRPEIRWAISMPMMVGGKLVGILNVNVLQRRGFTMGQIKALSILTTTGAAALEHAGLYQEARQAEERYRALANRLETVNEFSRLLGSTLDLKSLFGITLYHVSNLTECRWCCIARYDAASRGFEAAADWDRERGTHVGPHPEAAARTSPVATREAIEGLRGQRPLIVPDTRAPDEGADVQELGDDGIRSLVAVPVQIDQDLWGCLVVGFDEPHAITPDRVEFLGSMASHLAVAVKNAVLYAQLQQAYDELRQTQRSVVEQERLRALGQMASGVAHDLNNALVPTLGFAELLLDRPENLADTKRVQEQLQLILTSAQDAARVVSRLREFYRPRDDNEVVAPVNLNAVVERAVALSRPRWKDQALAAGITIRVETDLTPVPPIVGNEGDLREAVMNLVFNAVDAMTESGVLTLRTRFDGDSITLDVIDTGMGMSDETRRHCLEPFFSTKGEQGTGLGLPMVYGIMKRHDGTIEISSAPGQGTTVSLVFPIGQGAPAPEPAPPPSTADQRRLRVLVVDDEDLVREVIAQYLANDGHAVETAPGGADALAKFRSGSFDLVVTDRGMPEMTGDQVAAAMKALHPETPIILMTGFGDLMRVTGDRPAAVDEIISKPVRMAALRDVVARLTAA